MSSLSSRPSQAYYQGTTTDTFNSRGDSNRGSFSSRRSSSSRRAAGEAAEVESMPPIDVRSPPSLGQLSPQQRLQVYEEVLISERDFLCKRLTPSRHFPYLKSKRCFDRSSQERVNHHVTSVEKVDAFIEEIIKGGLNAMVAFFESLERQRVEEPILTRLLASCQSSLCRLYSENALTNENHGDSHRHHDPPFDVVDEGDSASHHTMPGQLQSMPLGTEGGVSYDLEGEDEVTFPPIPRVDVDRLRRAQGITEMDSLREGEEGSDVSSNYELTSHGGQQS